MLVNTVIKDRIAYVEMQNNDFTGGQANEIAK